MMGGLTPANSVVDAFGAVCTRVLRSVKLIGDDTPAGITWQTKVRKPLPYSCLGDHYSRNCRCRRNKMLASCSSYCLW